MVKSVETLKHPGKGVTFLLVKIFTFSFQDVIIKKMSGDYSANEIVCIRSIFALVLILLLAHFHGGLQQFKTRHLTVHIIRSALLFATFISYYLSLAALSIAEAITLSFTAPLFITLLSVVILGERVRYDKWISIFIGFMGVVFMLKPGAHITDPAALLTILSAFLYALSSIATRQLGNTESGLSLAFYPTLFYIFFSLLFTLLLPGSAVSHQSHASLAFLLTPWRIPTPMDLSFIVILGFIAAVGFYCLSQAYRLAPPSTIAPFEYFSVFLGVVWGYLFWGDFPDASTFVGIILIVGSGLYVYLGNRKQLPLITDNE